MGRKKKKPGYDAVKVRNEMMELAATLYLPNDMSGKQKNNLSLRDVAEELDISVSKVVKLLITGGYYTSDLYEQVIDLYESGNSIESIQKILGVSRATVHSYLPYRKGIYNAKETSLNAERIKRYRERQQAVEELDREKDFDSLWKCIELFEGYLFHTAKGYKYNYNVKGGEIFVDRKEASKSIKRSTVELAYNKGLELMEAEGFVSGPKKLGTFGASYLYPMFIRFGVIRGRRE